MQTAWRRRSFWAIAASVLAHLGVLTAVLMQHPTLSIPFEPGGPPAAVIPLLIVPRTAATPPGRGGRPTPIQLHRRPQRNLPPETVTAPVFIPTTKSTEATAPVAPPTAAKEAQPPPPASDAVRTTLRATLGCTAMGLSRDERATCLEHLGRGATDAPYLQPLLSSEKRAALDKIGAAKLAERERIERGPPAPGTPPPPADYDGEPDVGGPGVSLLGPIVRPPSKRAAPVLGRLPP